MKRKSLFDFIIAFGIALLFSLLHLTSFYEKSENRLYDILLKIKPPIQENRNILLLNIDDLAIAKVGLYPWSREILADGLITMKEFSAGYAVFDIEFVEESPMAVNSTVLKDEIPELFGQEFVKINENVSALFSAISAGSISIRDAKDYIADLQGLTEQSKNAMLGKVETIAKNNDIYLGQAARFFGNAFFTVNMLPQEDPDVSQNTKDYALENENLKNVSSLGDTLEVAIDIRPAILPILSQAKGAGFPNIIVDEDGVRRRLEILYKFKGKYFPQLAFSALLDWMGNPSIEARKDRIILTGATLPDGTKTDINIPLTEKGKLLINWPKKNFEESFAPHLSYYYLVLYKRQVDALLGNLKIMEQAGYLTYDKSDVPIMDAYRYAEEVKQDVLSGGSLDKIEEYRNVRELFFTGSAKFLSEDT
ncbi:MAG: CHASE2 domain-containing protein, partial [Spirochaetales bacterium]